MLFQSSSALHISKYCSTWKRSHTLGGKLNDYFLLSAVTGTESEAAAYEFTTLTCIPGVIHYKGTKIQLLDLPGIIEGAASGKGRGRYFSCTTISQAVANHAQQPLRS
jgi:hypothetical protein